MRFSNVKTGQRLKLGFGAVLLFPLILGLVSAMAVHKVSDLTEKLHAHPLAVSNAVRNIHIGITSIHRSMKDVLLADTDQQTIEAVKKIDEDEKMILENFIIVFERFLGDKNVVTRLNQHFLEWKTLRDQIIQLSMKGMKREAMDLARNKSTPLVMQIESEIKHLSDFAKEKAALFLKNAIATKNQSLLIIYTVIASMMAIGLFLSITIAHTITAPLQKMVKAIGLIADGALDEAEIPDDRHDEIGDLATSLQQMVATLKQTTALAKVIASGNHQTDIIPRSNKDELGHALQGMTHSLREISQKNEISNWFKNGRTTMDDQLRGELSTLETTERIVRFICNYLQARVGALYVNDGNNSFSMLASYAYKYSGNISHVFGLGEGLIGQAALERKPLVLTKVPDDYLKITSGIGERSPLTLLISPFIHDQTVTAVLELGSFEEFSDIQLTFINDISERLAIAINSALSREKLSLLLEETQRQSEELQYQQEELRASNEELEQQSEELQVTNEELEEKSESLEKQRAELNQAKEEIEAKAKAIELASRYKSEFLANMSHELRSPLNSLLILAKSLAGNDEGNLSEEQVEAARIIHSGGHDLLNLINDILDLSKVEAGRLEVEKKEVRFPSLIHDIKNQFNLLAKEKGLAFAIELSPSVPEVMVTDEHRLKQILKNLLSNAIKFTSQGSVTLTIKALTNDRDHTKGELHDAEQISFAVVDTGIGIPIDKQQAIFEAFQQADGGTSRNFGGTGLGLTISRRLANLLGGEITIASQEGEGSTFTLYLPISDHSRTKSKSPVTLESELPHAPAAPMLSLLDKTTFSESSRPQAFIDDDRQETKAGDKSVLIIEDDKAFAKILLKMAREKGYKALAAGDGRSGMFMAHEYQPKAIILDLGLPDIEGVVVLENLKHHLSTRHIPVHVISAQNPSPVIRQKGAFGYLAKPVALEDLAQVFSQFDTFFIEGGKKLLLVEDDPVSRKQTTKLLTHPGVEIVTAATGQEAMDLLTTQSFDCVVLDLTLPDMNGFELLCKLEQTAYLNKEMPVIIYTGREMSSEENDLLQKYARTVVVKGAESEERLLDEVSLFLHSMVLTMPTEQQKIIRMIHDKDEVLRGKKILLVDDDMRNVFALSGVLGKNGMQVVIAANGEQALQKLASEKDVDLVLMDIMMPVMDGYEAMQKIREQAIFQNLPIIALTAKAMPEDRTLCMNAGASDYITKPLDQEKLFSLMRVWLFK